MIGQETTNGTAPVRSERTIVADEKLLRLEDVKGRTGLGKTSIYDMMAQDRFPKPVRIGESAVRWKASELDAWIASLPTA